MKAMRRPLFADFSHLERHLASLGLFHMDLSLGRMEAFLTNAGRVSGSLGVQIVGTNGKGSTAAFLDSLAVAHGVRVGRFTSPHFLTVRERVLVDGAMLSEADWTRLGNEVAGLSGPDGLTYFEFVTALAVLAFAEAGVELAVWEAGLGGRYDATCALEHGLTLFTPFGLDHEHVLGKGLAAIARDKAHALRPGRPGLSAPQRDEAWDELSARSRAVNLDLALVDPDRELGRLGAVRLGLRGPFQKVNASLALAGWRRLGSLLGRGTDPDACRRGLARAFAPGRFQVADEPPGFLLDGAHNEAGLEALEKALEAEGVRPRLLVTASMRDKNLEAMLPVLRRLAANGAVCPDIPGLDRLLPPADLARALGKGARTAPDLAVALREAVNGPVLICGSLYLLAEFYKLHPRFLLPESCCAQAEKH